MTVRHDNRIRQDRQEPTDNEHLPPILDRCRETAERAMQENPMIATLAVYGVGLGVGTLIGSILADSGRPASRQFSESVGRRVLSALSDVVL